MSWVRKCVERFVDGDDILVFEDLGKDDPVPAPGSRTALTRSSTTKDLQNLQVLNIYS